MGSLTVDYKGDTIHSASSTGSATLKTSGKYMEDDVELTYSFDAATSVESSKSYTVSASGSQNIFPTSGYDAMAKVALVVPTLSLPTSTSGSATSGYTSKATIGRSTSDQYINIPTGYNDAGAYYKVSAVANGTEGTPTATKGTVSSNSISVTPSVTNSAGYISGGTKTGTAVTVSASELVSGTYTVNASGSDINITNYKYLTVPSGSATGPSSLSESSAVVSTGTNTLTLTKTGVTTTPTVSAGYVSSATSSSATVALTASVTTKGATTYTPTTTDQTIASGTYLTGAQTISGDVNLVAGNIKKNVPIFGVTGSYEGGGGSAVEEVEEGVEFIDYDGTLVETWPRGEIASKTALPTNPYHSGLTAQGWNWTLNEIKTYAASYPNALITVGQMYTTASGATEIDIVLDDENYLSPYLNLNGPTGTTIEVDWGDGSSKDTINGTSAGGSKYTQHVYATTGSYTIKIEVTSSSGYCYTYSTSTSHIKFLQIADTSNAYNQQNLIYANTIKAIRLHNSFRLRNYTFSYLNNLEYITLPNNLHTDVSGMFSYCISLKCLILPASLLGITSDNAMPTLPAIQNCYSLKKLSYSNNITAFNSAFQALSNLESVTLSSSITTASSVGGSSEIKKIIVPSGVTTIPISFCNACYCLEYAEFPSTVNTISLGNLFYSCYCLKKVVFKNNNPTTVNSGITTISDSTNFCYNCYSLKEIILPKKLTIIGNGYFQNCRSLKTIEIPSDVTDIGNSAFQYCYSLKTITIPSKVTTIGSYAFSSCYSLQEIHFEPTTPPTVANSNAWTSLPTTCTIYVPTGYLSNYTGASNYPSSSTYTYVEE